MTTKQHADSLIVRLVLIVGLLWGAWHECGPFTWTILCLLTVALEFRILANKNNELDDAKDVLRQTLTELRRKGAPDDRH